MRISVLSCGWLGFPLALQLQQDGFIVKGARTSETGVAALTAAGITGYPVRLETDGIIAPDDFFKSDLLILNIPPQISRGRDYHLQQIQQLIHKLPQTDIRKIIFVSSTSVYPEVNDVLTETDTRPADKPGGQVLREVETLLQSVPALETTVLRFGGLIGYDRVPDARTVAARSAVAAVPVNLLHRDDAIGIIQAVIRKEAWGMVLNACATEHPLRREYYQAAAEALGFEMPELPGGEGVRKIVSSEKLKTTLSYQFIHDDPRKIFISRPAV